MKKLLILILCIASASAAVAQKGADDKESYYVFDKDWKPCDIKAASYMAVVNKLNDTAFEWKFYNYTGPLISIETFRDNERSALNGYVAYYDTKGRIDSSGFTVNGIRDSTWYFYDDTLFVWLEKKYTNGQLTDTTNFYEKRKEEAKAGTVPSGFVSVESEAEFPGGAALWRKYIEKNFRYPDRAAQLQVKGTTITVFTVGVNGKTKDIRILQSVEFSADKEAKRIISSSPPWNPAVQNGRKVKAYRKQPITFG